MDGTAHTHVATVVIVIVVVVDSEWLPLGVVSPPLPTVVSSPF